MKYKIIGLSATALVLIAVMTIRFLMPEDNGQRFIEHIEAPQKEACTNHQGELCSHLPIVQINTGGKEVPGKVILDEEGHLIDYTLAEDGLSTVKGTLGVISNEEKNNHLI